jgi:translation initiation factor 2 subunit 1
MPTAKRVPREGELVICKVTSINPNSVFARLESYDREGMIHVSEVAGRWVRDIREFVRQGQVVVCRVIRIEGDHISLSLKRVSNAERSSRINEFKREKKSEKLLELAAKQMGMKLDEAYEKAGNDLIENFGSLTKGFEFAEKGAETLTKRGIDAKWAAVLSDVAVKSRGEKSYELKAELTLTSYRPDGVEAIKGLLSNVPEGYEVRYISAPKYVVSVKGSDRKAMEAGLTKIASSLAEGARKADGSGSFKILSD